MHRIDQDGHVANQFSEGNPALGQQPTRVGAAWLNAIQEEIVNVIVGRGVALSKGNNAQLAGIISGAFARLGALEANVDDEEWTYSEPRDRSVLVPLQGALPFAIAVPHSWRYEFDSILSATQRLWSGLAQGDLLELPFGHLVPSGGRPTSVQVLVRPSGARATNADRLLVEVVRQTHDFGTNPARANVPASTVLGSARDNGTANLQVVSVALGGAQPLHGREDQHLFVRMTVGAMLARPDAIVGVRVAFTDPGPRNA